MNYSKKIVSRMPLTKLWTDAGELSSSRQRYLNREEIKGLLKQQAFTTVIANIGSKLQWIHEDTCYDFWNADAVDHIPEEEEFSLEDFRGHYAYVASEWSSDSGSRLILLEVFH